MWRSPEESVMIGFSRSRVVMMNECHDGLLRCLRTREIGRRILPTAHKAGARYLAMEALNPLFTINQDGGDAFVLSTQNSME